MELKATQTINTDVLVIGGGAAGLRAAIEARNHGLDVLLSSESPVGFKNNTAISKATFAAAGLWKSEDSPELHIKDTIDAGRFLNDRRLLETMVEGARQQVDDLAGFGVVYAQRSGQAPKGRVAGHTYSRHITAEDGRGINISRPMRQHALSIGVRFVEGILVTKLLQAEGMVVGALGMDGKGQVLIVNAKSTVLATGGAGQVYLRTNNAIGLTGDGYALAYDAGATLRDMEFVQFYPTAWGKNGSRMCMYEWFLPRGATLRNSLGEDIVQRHGMKNMAITRDILTRAIMKEISGSRGINGNVIFDFTTLPEEHTEALYGFGLTDEAGCLERLLVAPTTHFFMGGVKVNESSETGIDGLYAAGEVCGGIHGANRLGGNALTETFVFGTIAGDRAASRASRIDQTPADRNEIATEVERLNELASGNGEGNLGQLPQALKQVMWDRVGVIRDEQGLQDALREILALRGQLRTASAKDYRKLSQAIKLDNMLTISEMVCRAALIRTESRGAHYRTDFPEEDNEQWLKTIEISRQAGEMTLRIKPVNGDR